jgi:hypothetical protein
MKTKSEKSQSLDKLIRSFGKMNESERNRAIKLWEKAKQDHLTEKKPVGSFNPTTMDNKTYKNFLNYLQLTLIDEQVTGNQREFIPSQDYGQELRREFRTKGVAGSIIFEGNEKRINKELAKIRLRDENLSKVLHFIDTLGEEYPSEGNATNEFKKKSVISHFG